LFGIGNTGYLKNCVRENGGAAVVYFTDLSTERCKAELDTVRKCWKSLSFHNVLFGSNLIHSSSIENCDNVDLLQT
jgi:hypothetical protein